MATIKVKKASPKSEINMTVRAYVEQIEDDEIDFDIDIQRPYVWKDIEQKSGLIQSLIVGDIIPPFIFNRIEGKFEALDSKQRSLTIRKFLNDEFALQGVIPIEIINEDGELEEIDINGCKFSELPDYIQNAIKDYNLSIWYLNEAGQDEVARNFYNLNNGLRINTATMNRIKAKCKDQIFTLGKHELFKEALSQSALEGHVNEDLVGKAHAVLNAEEPCMNAPWVRKYMRDADITKADEEDLTMVFNRIRNIHSLIEDNKVKRRIYTQTHMISIVPVILTSIYEGRTDEEVMKWFVTFFNGGRSATTSKTYNSASSSGSGRKEAVRKRLEAVEKSYKAYFKDKEKCALDKNSC